MVASVPEFTSRTFSMLGTICLMSSAISTSRRVGAPNERECSAAAAHGVHHEVGGVAQNHRAPRN